MPGAIVSIERRLASKLVMQEISEVVLQFRLLELLDRVARFPDHRRRLMWIARSSTQQEIREFEIKGPIGGVVGGVAAAIFDRDILANRLQIRDSAPIGRQRRLDPALPAQ